MAHALGVRRLDLYVQFDRQLAEPELARYRELVARRVRREPVAYVVGHKEFMALDFEVTRDVLVPNPDTEVLVQRAVAIARDAGGPLRAADVGTGSGCIAIALAHYAANVEVWAGDISEAALAVAARNVRKHGLDERVHLSCGDLMQPISGEFDLVCANLPYVRKGVDLAPEVTAQPAVALYASQEGTELVVRLLREVAPRLRPHGRVLAELDPAIAPAAVAATDGAYAGHRLHRDLGGHERVIEAWS
jgi:release factor glutamine methyltransferase